MPVVVVVIIVVGIMGVDPMCWIRPSFHYRTYFFVVFSALEELLVDLVIGIQRKFFDGFVAIGKARQKHDE